MDKFMLIESTLLRVKALANKGKLLNTSFDPFIEACLKGHANELSGPQLKILFDNLAEIEFLLKEQRRPVTSVGNARNTLMFVLENNSAD